MIAISKELCVFFNNHSDNTIELWDCLNNKWHLHTIVTKKQRNSILFLCTLANHYVTSIRRRNVTISPKNGI